MSRCKHSLRTPLVLTWVGLAAAQEWRLCVCACVELAPWVVTYGIGECTVMAWIKAGGQDVASLAALTAGFVGAAAHEGAVRTNIPFTTGWAGREK